MGTMEDAARMTKEPSQLSVTTVFTRWCMSKEAIECYTAARGSNTMEPHMIKSDLAVAITKWQTF